MAITHTKYQRGVTETVTGKIVADGSAANVELGFVPSMVWIFNYTNPSFHVWSRGMTDGYVGTIPASGGTLAVATTGGISDYAGDATHAPGFTIGTDSTLNTASDVLYYVAFR